MRYREFKIIETDEPNNNQQDDLGTSLLSNVDTPVSVPTQQELTTPEQPNANNTLANNDVLGNALRTLFVGLFGTLLSRVFNQNPMFAGVLRTILSGNSGGFDPRQILGAAPASMRPQVERVLQFVDPATGELNNDGTNITPANNASGWTRIRIGETEYEVGNDLVRQGNVYAIFSGNSAKEHARANGWIVPPIEVIQAVYRQGTKLIMPTRNNNPTDTNAQAHTQQIFETNNLRGFPGGLVCGHKKEVVGSSENRPGRTRIYGGWNGSNIIQGDSSVHGGSYLDYSQGLRACRIVNRQRTA